MDDARKGKENALRTNPLDVREQYEKQLHDLQEAYGEAMLELRAALLHKSVFDRSSPSRRGTYPTGCMTGMPRTV